MLRITVRRITRFLLFSSLPVALAIQTSLTTPSRAAAVEQKAAPAAGKAPAEDGDKNDPPFHEYKGVRIGMAADEARKKLGDPADKSDRQDFYTFSDNESAQVFYDAEKKVFAISVNYLGGDKSPTCKSILGAEAEAKPDGSIHRRVDYPKAGFWVAYSRTPGDEPMVTVTMQKKP